MFKKKHAVLCTALAIASGLANAKEGGDVIEWHGYLNAAYGISESGTTYNEHLNNNGSVNESGFGVSASAKLPENWSVAMQIFAHGAGGDQETFEMDWAFATYEPSDSFALRLGKIKYPGSLISEYMDVGFSYPWIHPPQEFYSNIDSAANMVVESFTGVSPLFKSRSGSTRYLLQPYAGESEVDHGSAKKLIGLKAGVSGDGFEALVNVNRKKLVLDGTMDFFAETNDKTHQTRNIGASIDRNNVLMMAEYGKSTTSDAPDFDTTAGYLTVGYRSGNYLPSLTYASFDQKSGTGQKSVTATLRYDLNNFSAIKFQIQSIDPDQRTTPTATGFQGAGLFEALPAEGKVKVFSASFNLVF